jgi:hypothetical protein
MGATASQDVNDEPAVDREAHARLKVTLLLREVAPDAFPGASDPDSLEVATSPERAALELADIAQGEHGKAIITEEGGVSVLVRLLASEAVHSALETLEALTTATSRQTHVWDARQLALDAGVIHYLPWLLESERDSAVAVKLLRNLTLLSEAKASIASAPRVIPRLITLLATPTNEMHCVADALMALADIPAVAESLIVGGAIPPTVAMIRRWTVDVDGVAESQALSALRLLRNLAVRPQSHPLIVKEKALPSLVRMIEVDSLTESASHILWMLMVASEAVKRSILHELLRSLGHPVGRAPRRIELLREFADVLTDMPTLVECGAIETLARRLVVIGMRHRSEEQTILRRLTRKRSPHEALVGFEFIGRQWLMDNPDQWEASRPELAEVLPNLLAELNRFATFEEFHRYATSRELRHRMLAWRAAVVTEEYSS